MAKRFTYGGFTFVADGTFKDYGFKGGKRGFINICRTLHYPNSGNVADGDEKFNYDEFYKVAGKCKDDVFLCEENGERYVPCSSVLAVFDQTSDSDAVWGRYNRRRMEREEREREAKREALKEAMIFTEEQHQAYIKLCKVINECMELGMQFAYDGDHVHVFRADLLKDITMNMAPSRGQEAIDERSLCQCITGAWDIREGLYANVKE